MYNDDMNIDKSYKKGNVFKRIINGETTAFDIINIILIDIICFLSGIIVGFILYHV